MAELAYVRAEALYRLGDRAAAMALVNESRARGELPAFTDPGQPAPGGARCVPRMSFGSCGDLFEALQYEKRIEVFHYGPFTEFLDEAVRQKREAYDRFDHARNGDPGDVGAG